MYPTKGCGDCAACRDGRTHHCASFTVSDVHRDGGSFAEYVAAPVDQLIKLPESLRSIHGALAEPATVGVHANLQGGMAAGKRVAVIGAGTIGSMIAQVARGWGAADVVIVDRMPARRALAADLGFDHFVLSGAGGEEEELLSFGGPVRHRIRQRVHRADHRTRRKYIGDRWDPGGADVSATLGSNSLRRTRLPTAASFISSSLAITRVAIGISLLI